MSTSQDSTHKSEAIGDEQHVKLEKGLDETPSFTNGNVAVQHQKPFSVWSAMSLGYNITNTGIGLTLVVGNAVLGAGPLFIYGTFLVAAISLCVAITLGELSSAYPHAGGQYFWVAKLAPERFRRFLSYMTAILSWAAVICTGASAAQGLSNVVFQLVMLMRPDFPYQRWMGFLAMEAFNIMAALTTLHENFLPKLAKGFMFFSIATVLTIVIALLAPSTEKQTAAVVFGADGYFNLSGWPDGMAFLIGLSGPNWGISCLDAATHLAEELPNPRKNIPIALLYTVGIGLAVGTATNLAMFFAATDLPNTTSLVGLLLQVYKGNPACAYVIGTMVCLIVFNALAGIHTWQARITFALSRDRGTPFHAHMGKLAPAPLFTPVWATFWGVAWIGLCGCLYLGSITAFNSFVSAGIVLQYITYATPAILLLIKGRDKFAHGPFFWPKFGLISNVVVIVWAVLSLIIYSFAIFLPVLADEMNYLCVVIVFSLVYAEGYWVLYGSKHYELTNTEVVDEH